MGGEKISDLDEFLIIEKILKYLHENPLGKNEDAIAWKINDLYIIVNIDSLVRKTDVLPVMTPEDIGRKLVIMTCSDVIAKGGIPKIFLASGLFPGDESIDYLLRIVKGIRDTCDEYEIKYVGGDLGEAEDIILSGVALGLAKKLLKRSGLKPGDLVWTTGEFGLTGAAFHYVLFNGRRIKNMNRILESVKKPKLRLDEAKVIFQIATASMDSSDGLAITLNEMARMSNVKIIIEQIPLAKEVLEYAKENNLNPLSLAFFAGEEFELVFGTRGMSEEEVIEYFKSYKLKEPFLIGRVESGSGVFYKNRRIERKGWSHFANEWYSLIRKQMSF